MKNKSTAQPFHKWKLDDGTEVTSKEVSEIAGVSLPTARWRLKNSTDPDKVFKSNRYTAKGQETRLRWEKTYTLDDGTKWTATQVAEKVFLTRECASARLVKYSNPERVFARKGQRVFMSEIDTEIIDKPKTILYGIQLEPVKEPDSASYTIEMYARAEWLQQKGALDFLYHPDEDEDLPCPSWKEGQE